MVASKKGQATYMTKTVIELKTVPIDKIHISEVKFREVQTDSEEYEDLCRSVKVRGVQQTIRLRPWKHPETGKLVKDEYELVDGCQRIGASKAAGLTTIAAAICEMTDDEVYSMQYVLNMHRVKMTTKQLLEHFKKFALIHPNMSMPEIARHHLIKEQNLTRLLRLQNLIPQALELVEKGKIKTSAGVALASVPEEHQTDELIKSAMTMPSGEFISHAKAVKDAHAKAKREGKKVEGPVITPYPLGKTDLVDLWQFAQAQITSSDDGNPVNEQSLDYRAGFLAAMEKSLRVDPASLAEKKAQADKKRADNAEVVAQRKATAAQTALDEVRGLKSKRAAVTV